MENNRKDREILKSYFKSGNKPTEQQFAELIDSVSNMVEDKLLKSGEKGWMICPLNEQAPSIGFYLKEPDDKNAQPVWLLTVSPEKELLLKNERDETVLSIAQDMTVSLSGNLSVKGNVACQSIIGGSEKAIRVEVPADKKWHNLPIEAEANERRPGCRVYRVWACYQDDILGDCQMTEAVVRNCNYQTLKVTSSRKHWWGWSGALRIRWKQGDDGKLYLQMRSKSRGLKDGMHCQINEIWNYTEEQP